VVLVRVRTTARAVRLAMPVSKGRVHFRAVPAVQLEHRRIRVHLLVRRRRSTRHPPHQAVPRHLVLDRRLIPPASHRLRIAQDRRTTDPGLVRSALLPVHHRNSSVDLVPRDRHSYPRVPVIPTFHLMANRLVDRSTGYHPEARSDLVDTPWPGLWVLDIPR